jgi:hypothetical protein
VADAITLERRGMPAAAVGIEKLVNTTGRAMAKAQGAPDYPIAVVPHDLGAVEDLRGDEDVNQLAKTVVDQVEAILLGTDKEGAR